MFKLKQETMWPVAWFSNRCDLFTANLGCPAIYYDIRAGWKVYRNKHLNIYTDPLSLKAPAWGVGSETMKVKDFVCHDCSHSLNPAGEDWHFSATGRTCHPCHPLDRSLQQLVTTTFSAKLIPSCQVHPKIFKLQPLARKDESWCFNSSVIEDRLTIGCKYVSGIPYISCISPSSWVFTASEWNITMPVVSFNLFVD